MMKYLTNILRQAFFVLAIALTLPAFADDTSGTSNMEDYAISYNKGAVLNGTAKKLLDEAIGIELAEARLKQTYVVILDKILPSTKVARYIQIETKIRAIIRYGLAERIPLVN